MVAMWEKEDEEKRKEEEKKGTEADRPAEAAPNQPAPQNFDQAPAPSFPAQSELPIVNDGESVPPPKEQRY